MIDESLMERLLMESPDAGSGKKPNERKFYGVTIGRVINPIDFLAVGRVQVQLPFIDSGDLSAFARVAAPMAGIFHGDYFVPDVGDEVLVAFEHGDLNAPIIIASMWNVIQRPPLLTPLPQIRSIRTLTGNQVVFTELPPTLTLQNGPTAPAVAPSPPSPVGPFQTVALTPIGVQVIGSNIQITAGVNVTILVGGNTITVSPAGIAIASATQISLTAPAINITAAGPCTIVGKPVNINPAG